MKIEIKKYHLIAVSIVLIIIITVSVMAQLGLFTNDVSWHPLQQVATNNNGVLSVDADADNIIDNADGVVNGACRLCKVEGSTANACGGIYNNKIGRIADTFVGGSAGGEFDDNLFRMTVYPQGCGIASSNATITAREITADLCCRT